MQLGVLTFALESSGDPARLAEKAEQLGFSSFWVPEHPIVPVHYDSHYADFPDGRMPEPYSHISDPFVALARASAATHTIQLGTGVCLIPERNPLLLAKQVATLDHLSGGRFILGIGAGWLKEETEIMGGDFAHRWAQTKDAIHAMKALWTQDEAEYHGTYYNFPPVRSFPKPVQKPHPPILLGGTSQHVFQRIAQWGDGWMPVEAPLEEMQRGRQQLMAAADKAGRDPASIQVFAFSGPQKNRDPETLRALEKAGVDHTVLFLALDEKTALAELEDLARQLRPYATD